MNSGIVLKIYKNYVIVLTETCEYVKIKIGSLTPHIGEVYLGEVIDVKPNGYYLKKYKSLIIIISFAIILSVSYLTYIFFKPVNYIYLKGYEEINLKVNRFNIVIGADSLNTTADKVLANVKILNKKSSTSIIKLFDTSVSSGVLDEDFRQNNSVYRIKITDTTNCIDLSPVITHLEKSSFKSQIIYNGNLLFDSNGKL